MAAWLRSWREALIVAGYLVIVAIAVGTVLLPALRDAPEAPSGGSESSPRESSPRSAHHTTPPEDVASKSTARD